MGTLIILLSPLIAIQLGLMAFALRDLLKPERRIKGESKLVWALVIIFINLIGPLAYFYIGREED